MDSMSDTEFDVVVIGGGIMGSCAAYEMSKRGLSTLLLDQFDFLHNRGSSHGESRTIRVTYPEPYYPPLVVESARLWEQAQSEIGYRVLYPTTQLDMGPSDDASLQAAIASCRANSVGFQVLDPAQLAREFSGRITIPEGWIGVVTQDAGVIKPTKAVSMFQALALRNGAVLKDNTEVTDIERRDDKISVSTARGDKFCCRKCVIAAGAWMGKLVHKVTGQRVPIQPLETTICYWKIKQGHEEDCSIQAGFPTFAGYGTPYVYGTPSLEYPGLIKIAVHGGRPCDPGRRTWVPQAELIEELREWVRRIFGGLVELESGPVSTQSCLYSVTPDEDYVVDFLGGEFGKDVVVAGGFSGHGFKMGPVIGRVVADLVLHGEAQEIELRYFKLDRFDSNPKGNAKGFAEQVGVSSSHPIVASQPDD